MIALAASVFVAGLLGSVHCAAMCGSFACLASGSEGAGARAATGAGPTTDAGAASGASRGAWRGTAAYNAGRLLSYLALGALAGAAGAGLDRAGAVVGFARPAAVVAGVLLIAWGTATLLAAFGVRVPVLAVPPSLASAIARGVRAVRAQRPAVRGLALGALTAALPCGWLYAFVATSSAAGSALRGAAVMAAFWAGTLPMMAAVGLGAQRLLGPARRRLPALTAAALVLLGALTVAGRFSPAMAAHTEGTAHGQHDAR
jgi:sulfite exporter TauE/SafE